MDQSKTIGADISPSSNSIPTSNPATSARVESAAQTAHRTVDNIADRATAQVDRVSGAVHRTVNSAADAAASAGQWASSMPEQAKEVQTKITQAACASIRARPISTVAGALVIGYLLGRLARL